MSRTRFLAAVGVAALALFAVAAGAGAAPKGPDQVVEGAKKIGRGVEEAAKGVATTVTEGAKQVGRELEGQRDKAAPVGDRLHDSAKRFGQALWDGVKYVGHTVKAFFTAE